MLFLNNRRPSDILWMVVVVVAHVHVVVVEGSPQSWLLKVIFFESKKGMYIVRLFVFYPSFFFFRTKFVRLDDSCLQYVSVMDGITIVTFVGIAAGVVLVVGFIVVQDKVEFCNNGMGVSIVVQESY